MSPIENVVPNLVEEAEKRPDLVELRFKQDRTRDLFGIQLEVIRILLDMVAAVRPVIMIICALCEPRSSP